MPIMPMNCRWALRKCWLLAALAATACGQTQAGNSDDAFAFGGFEVSAPDIKIPKDIKDTKDTQDTGADLDVDTTQTDDEIGEDSEDLGPEDTEEVSTNPCEPNPCVDPNKGLCSNDKGVAVCSCDAGFDPLPDDSCGPACDLSLPPPKPQQLAKGDLVVTEIMFDPVAAEPSAGEWFEVKNHTDTPIDVNGLTLTDDVNDNHVVHTCLPLMVKPGGVLTFAQSSDTTKNGGFKPDYVYGQDMILGINDKIILRAEYSDSDNLDVDSVAWGFKWPLKAYHGKAMSLDVTTTTADDNDAFGSWCPSSKAMSDGDSGSPGSVNPACPAPPDADQDGIIDTEDDCPYASDPQQSDSDGDAVGDACDNCPQIPNANQSDVDKDGKGDACDEQKCGDGEPDLNESCDDGNTIKNDGCEACQVTPVVAGKILISELMVHSENFDDSAAEWIELYNPTADYVAINGWTIALKKGADGTGPSHLIQYSGNLTVPPLGYLVLGASDNKAFNGNVKVNYAYGAKLQMLNDADVVSLIDTTAGKVVDTVAYGTNTPAPIAERTLQLDPKHLDSLANDKKLYWCQGSAAIPDSQGQPTGEKGTPGQVNTSCTPPGLDADADNVLNELDNCVFTANQDQADKDGDGFGDACDDCPGLPDKNQGDSDSDGVGDFCDNCGNTVNPDQIDGNGNGYGDACDSPTCGNGTVDAPTENCDDSNKDSGDGCSMTCQKESFIAGALIVTEAMINPKVVEDEKGEWVEVYNPGDKPVDLNGWVLRDDTANSTIIKSDKALRVMPKSYFVLGCSTDKTVNGGANVDFAYPAGAFLMNNASPDQIVLEWNKIAIDKVSYQPKGYSCGLPSPPANCADIGFPVPVGKSMQLDPGSMDVTKNDDAKSWCEAKTSFGSGDWGSPDLANPPCINPCEGKADNTSCGTDLVCLGGQCVPAPKCADGILQVSIGEECDDGNLTDGDGCSSTCKKEIPPQPDGTLVITEVMPNPDAVSDQKGEWFEIYNPTANAIDLTGWTLKSATYTHKVIAGGPFVPNPPILQPKTYGVLIALSDSTQNNGIKALYAWIDEPTGGFFALLNTGQVHITLVNPAGKTIDDINYGGLPWLVGGSAMLKPECYNPVDNDKPDCWIPASPTCAYGPQIGLSTFDWATGSCQVDGDCTTDPLQKCIAVKQTFDSGSGKTTYTVDKTGDLKCAVRERGTPMAANVCK
jgi:cysteine-rich repeat protein